MTSVIIKELDYERIATSRQKEVEQYNTSIDKTISTEYASTFAECIAAPENTEMYIEVSELIDLFDPKLRKIVLMLFYGFNKAEIVSNLRINPQRYERCLEIIRKMTSKYLEL